MRFFSLSAISRSVAYSLTVVSAMVLVTTDARAQDPIYDARGFQPGREVLSLQPFEHLDTSTGNLILTFTDLTLPGPAGFDVRFVRTFNSQDDLWNFGLANAPMFFTTASAGDLSDVTFHTVDGAAHRASGFGETTYTSDFWMFAKSTHTLSLPNGVEATYAQQGDTENWYLTEIRDPFDNTVSLAWSPQIGGPQLTVTQQLGSNQSRSVVYDQWLPHTLASMTSGGRQWSYGWDPGSELRTVTMPEGLVWKYRYASFAGGRRGIDLVTTPNGGTISYNYTTATINRGGTTSYPFVVASRMTGGRAPSGTWTFEYVWQYTVVHTPSAWLSFLWEPLAGTGQAIQKERTVAPPAGGGLLEHETLTYDTVAFDVYTIPIVASRTLLRGTRSFTTTYSYSPDNFKDYGNPQQIVEQGELSRTTMITYRHDFARYVKGRVASVAVDGFTRSYSYNDQGFLTGQTIYGVDTQFAPDGAGNVASVTDANNRMTTFTYDSGVLKDTGTPEFTIGRTINADGTVASETVGIVTTSFTYDALGRLTSANTDTPGREATTTSYPMSGDVWDAIRVSQGSSSSTLTDLDGFGQPTHSADLVGVQTSTTMATIGCASSMPRAWPMMSGSTTPPTSARRRSSIRWG